MQSTANLYGPHVVKLNYEDTYSDLAIKQLINKLDDYIVNVETDLLKNKAKIIQCAEDIFNSQNTSYQRFKSCAAQGHTRFHLAWQPQWQSKYNDIFSKVFNFTFQFKETHHIQGYLIDGSSSYYISYPKSTPIVFLMPDLDYTIPDIKCDPHLNMIFETKNYSDVSFIIENKEVKAHRVILSKLPFFNTLFSRWTVDSKQSSSITLSQFSYADFEFIMKYVYTGKVDEGYFSIAANCLSLLKAATALEFESLKTIAKFHLFAQKDPEIFLDLALFSNSCLPDGDLSLYCQRFFQAFPSYVETLDLSCLDSNELTAVIKVGEKYRQGNLIECARTQLRKISSLDVEMAQLTL